MVFFPSCSTFFCKDGNLNSQVHSCLFVGICVWICVFHCVFGCIDVWYTHYYTIWLLYSFRSLQSRHLCGSKTHCDYSSSASMPYLKLGRFFLCHFTLMLYALNALKRISNCAVKLVFLSFILWSLQSSL